MTRIISLLLVVMAIGGCGRPDPRLAELRLAALACRDGVKGQLNLPKDAVFAMDYGARRINKTTIKVESWVEVKNNFGITTRKRFTCDVSVNAGQVKVEDLDLPE